MFDEDGEIFFFQFCFYVGVCLCISSKSKTDYDIDSGVCVSVLGTITCIDSTEAERHLVLILRATRKDKCHSNCKKQSNKSLFPGYMNNRLLGY